MLTVEMKKLVKSIYKDRQKGRRQREDVKGLVKFGVVTPTPDYQEVWTVYAIFDRSLVRLGELYREIEKLVSPHGESIHSIYDCTGKRFSRRARVRIFRDRIVLIQHQGLDV